MLSRIAGDEFICLLKGYSRSQTILLGEHAQDEVSSFYLEVRPEQYAQVGLSFGVAEFPTDGQTIDELLNAAALATRQNKTSVNAKRVAFQSQAPPFAAPRRGKTGPLALVR